MEGNITIVYFHEFDKRSQESPAFENITGFQKLLKIMNVFGNGFRIKRF
ncbi:MAG: hypothetical protein JW762_15025 [Dehalococcoidales bacterium]|nr:hypothetical protein [Dehalococcoidales bacterium]